MKEKLNYLFLFLGLFSIILALLDFLIETDIYGGLLAIAWGLLFILLFFKKIISIQTYNVFLVLVVIFFVASGLFKLMDKLDLI